MVCCGLLCAVLRRAVRSPLWHGRSGCVPSVLHGLCFAFAMDVLSLVGACDNFNVKFCVSLLSLQVRRLFEWCGSMLLLLMYGSTCLIWRLRRGGVGLNGFALIGNMGESQARVVGECILRRPFAASWLV